MGGRDTKKEKELRLQAVHIAELSQALEGYESLKDISENDLKLLAYSKLKQAITETERVSSRVKKTISEFHLAKLSEKYCQHLLSP